MYSVRILMCVIVIVISIIITACICFLKTFIDQSQTLTFCASLFAGDQCHRAGPIMGWMTAKSAVEETTVIHIPHFQLKKGH